MSQREHKLSFKQLRQYLLNGYEVLMKTRAPESMRKPLVLFFNQIMMEELVSRTEKTLKELNRIKSVSELDDFNAGS